MAIFEKQITNKVSLDDTERLTCTIENAHNIDKHTEYTIRVQRGFAKDNTWIVSRRYNEFSGLQAALQPADTGLLLPPKKIIGNMQPAFIAERQIALQVYLDAIMKNFMLASSLPVKIFLDPKTYSSALSEMALQNVSMALRGDGNFELKSPLPNIGWRIRKHYYTVTRGQAKGDNYVMAWSTYGPDKTLTERDLQVAFKSLMNLEHPYIDKIVFMHSLETGAYVIRKVHPNGSVKDHLYGTQFGNPYLSKYANPKLRKPFTIGQCAHYGYQILQALKYLHNRGLPYGHLHPGNLAIENQQILLLDIENSLLGLPSYHRQLILEHRKICDAESIDVYSFGHTLYEMAFGEPLATSTCDIFPSNSSSELLSVLQMILSTSACKHGLPNIDTLLLHPFFSYAPSFLNGAHSDLMKNCRLKFSAQTKEQFKSVMSCIETRLKYDQKQVRAERRQIRIQEILSSEEELRKRKRKAKNKDSAISNSHTSLNGLSPLSMSGPSERSGSVASSLSTASSPSPPQIIEESPSAKPPVVFSAPAMDSNRSAFLDSICSFNKNKLNKCKK